MSCGLMPHPERACEAAIGSGDGLVLFESVVDALASRGVALAGGGRERTIDRRRRSRTARRDAATNTTRIVELLGREPNLTELGLFSVMWSEHCSYKSSRVHLKTLPTTARACCRARAKTPAPSTSATAWRRCSRSSRTTIRRSSSRTRARRPASAASSATSSRWARGRSRCSNALRFGSLDEPRTRRIIQGVVAGIGGYGNSIGIPTVGGEVMFDETYSGNPLVNVFCLGIARHDAIIKGTRERRRQPRLLRRRQDRPRRHSRRDDGVGGVRREVWKRSGRPCRSAIRSWRSCCSRPASR